MDLDTEIAKHLIDGKVGAGCLLAFDTRVGTLTVMRRVGEYWEPMPWPTGNDKHFDERLGHARIVRPLATVLAGRLGCVEECVDVKDGGMYIYELRSPVSA